MQIRRHLGKGVQVLAQADSSLGLYALFKPAGVVSHRDAGGKAVPSLVAPSCKYQYDQELFHTPDGPLHLCHRLDRETSGVMLVSTDAAVAAAVRAAFRQRTVRKGYQALSFGSLAQPLLQPGGVPLLWEDRHVYASASLCLCIGARMPLSFPSIPHPPVALTHPTPSPTRAWHAHTHIGTSLRTRAGEAPEGGPACSHNGTSRRPPASAAAAAAAAAAAVHASPAPWCLVCGAA